MVQVGSQTFPIEGPPPTFRVSEIYGRIYQKYPQLANVNFSVVNSQGAVMDKSNNIAYYGVDSNNCNVRVKGLAGYVFGSEGIIKCMKVNGEWGYNEEMIKFLNIQNLVQKHGSRYGEKTGKAMTASVLEYLQSHYPEKSEEYKLVYRKANKFLDA